MSDNDHDDIPTLGEIIFPGNPAKAVRPSNAPTGTQASSPPMPTPPPPTGGEHSTEPQSRPRPSSFETLISTRIDHILEKHMEAARDEIVRMVMLELRARLPGTGRPGSHQD